MAGCQVGIGPIGAKRSSPSRRSSSSGRTNWIWELSRYGQYLHKFSPRLSRVLSCTWSPAVRPPRSMLGPYAVRAAHNGRRQPQHVRRQRACRSNGPRVDGRDSFTTEPDCSHRVLCESHNPERNVLSLFQS